MNLALERNRRWRAKNPEKVRELARKSMKIWREKNPEKNRERANKWYAENKPHFRNYSLKKLYGITEAEFQVLKMLQNGVCAVCQLNQKTKKTDKLYVDHDRKTGRVRGLLCQNCNFALGLVDDDINKLVNLIKHLNMNLTKCTLTFDDGSTQEFDAAATTGEVIKDVIVENTDGTTETFTPAAPAA